MIRLLTTDLYLHNLRTRMPFKYGIATLTVAPHLFVRVQIEVDGVSSYGLAADNLPPKWFTKDPTATMADDIAGMLDVIRAACRHAQQIAQAESVFAFWQQLYGLQQAWAEGRMDTPVYPPLLWNFGVSLVERALIDAYCRAKAITFHQAVMTNQLGLDLGAIHLELQGVTPATLLPKPPTTTLTVRHTVGLVDWLTDGEIPTAERVDDGLPQSLAAAIRHYGLTHFKIKVGGNVANDLGRLAQIIRVIEANVAGDYAFTLDGNEQYASMADFRFFWDQLARTFPAFVQRLIFVEQPLHRDLALREEVGAVLSAWPDHPPLIIDESDGSLTSLPTALMLGYQGTSHKNCKGIFKGIANACLIAYRKGQGDDRLILSGEDLTNIGPVALLQDLAVLATLGVTHAERNGHHYFAGLNMWPPAVQRQVLANHGDLYRHQGELIAVNLQQGQVPLSSVTAAPFGVGFDLRVEQFMPVDEWRFDSLNLAG